MPLQVLTYGLYFDPARLQWTTLEVTLYDEKPPHNPLKWTIRRAGSVMSKKTGSFDYEPMPSNREDDWLEEYRFDKAAEAIACYVEHYPEQYNGT